ncbi:XdhC family protein [Altericroceibacterium spongiae]|uniref:XdhC family protein n=1 Tax=Altericroceibacterium spongiae TaxID=2320269 RepID=A0A420EM83_9SPHN|nr:XdhC family protein [Altericroceibacterium spongiae]RKF21726.1 XdhC family protein [Altericroceibacterium spongiae]
MPITPSLTSLAQRPSASDNAALLACADTGSALCTLIGIEGSFSRRLGAQLAIEEAGILAGSLADGCLEAQLVTEVQNARAEGKPRVVRFGAGSPAIDFRLPCGSGLDILVDPAPDRAACRQAADAIRERREASLPLKLPDGSAPDLLRERHYIPSLKLILFGEGPELTSLSLLAEASGLECDVYSRDDPHRLSLGGAPEDATVDRWTSITLLFHDHEWEAPLLKWALNSPAFHIGAQGGKIARDTRRQLLASQGVEPEALKRIISPIGLIPHSRDPQVLAVSVLAEIIAAYEAAYRHSD